MKRRIMSLLLVLLVLVTFTGCNEEQRASGEYQVYYFNIDKTKIEPEDYDSTGSTGEALIQELLLKLQAEPKDSQMRRTIPETIRVLGIKTNAAHLTLDFSKEYNSLSVTEEVLMRAAIVRTLLQCSEYSLVTFTVEAEPLKTKDGSLVGSMTMDSFLENPGVQINTSKQATLTLYFASGDGTHLVKETRDVHYSTNISLEKLVMEQLIEGPKKGAMATIPSETKIITLSVMDGICYVNLDNNFQNQNQEITEEVVLYSIVNSLTELSGVSKVQISINGDTSGKCRYTYDLSTMYEKNPNLLETKENGN